MGQVEGKAQLPLVLRRQPAILRGEAQPEGVVGAALHVGGQIVRRVEKIHDPAQVVQQFPQDALPVPRARRRPPQDAGEAVRRRVEGGAVLRLQRREGGKLRLRGLREIRSVPGGLPVRGSYARREEALPQGREKAAVPGAVRELPVGEDHGEVRRRVEGRKPRGTGGAAQRSVRTAPGLRFRRLPFREEHREEGQVIVHRPAHRRAEALREGVAQSAVDAAEGLVLPHFELPALGSHIAVHQRWKPVMRKTGSRLLRPSRTAAPPPRDAPARLVSTQAPWPRPSAAPSA